MCWQVLFLSKKAPPPLLALFSNPGTSDALACSLLERGVWLDSRGSAHADVTIPLPCGGISEPDATTWPASGTCCHPQPVQEALIFLPLAAEQSKGQVMKKHSAPSLSQLLFWGLSCKAGFWIGFARVKTPLWQFPGQSEPHLRPVWAQLPSVKDLSG